jgi:hypothetical protein
MLHLSNCLMPSRIYPIIFLVLFVLPQTASAENLHLPGVTLVEGRKLAAFQGQAIEAFRVYAFQGEAALPIPFQIDERDRRDRWVLDHGSNQQQNDFPGAFTENHAVVLMNRDLGRRGDLEHLPATATAWAEIRIGSEAHPLGFAYVGLFDPLLSLEPHRPPYSRYDPTTDRVYAERYALEFGAPLPTHVAFVNQLGEFGTNAVAGVRVLGEVRFLGGLLTLRRSDKDIQSELSGYRAGPVRVIRRARYWIPLPLGFRTSGRVDLLFYRDFVEGTALVKIGIPPRLVLANGELTTYFDFLDMSGARLFLDGVQPSAPIDGHMTPAKQALSGQPAHWAALLLPDGRTVLLIVRLEGALQKLDQRLYFAETTDAETASGGKPLFGFQFTRVNRLETGTHRLSVFAMVLDNTTPEEIRRTAHIFLSPPEVSVSVLKQ